MAQVFPLLKPPDRNSPKMTEGKLPKIPSPRLRAEKGTQIQKGENYRKKTPKLLRNYKLCTFSVIIPLFRVWTGGGGGGEFCLFSSQFWGILTLKVIWNLYKHKGMKRLQALRLLSLTLGCNSP